MSRTTSYLPTIYEEEGEEQSNAPVYLREEDDPEVDLLKQLNIGLNKAIKNKDLAMARVFIKFGADVHFEGYSSASALHYAASAGFTEIASDLTKKGAIINGIDNTGRTPLYLAAENGRVEFLKWLLDNRADVDAAADNEMTPLLAAVHYDKTEAAKLLIDAKANVNSTNGYGENTLYLAVRNNNIELISLLLENGADYRATNERGQTPLDIAIALKEEAAEGDDMQMLSERSAVADCIQKFIREKEIEAGAHLTEDEAANNPELVFLHAVVTQNVELLEIVLTKPALVAGDIVPGSTELHVYSEDTIAEAIANKAEKNKSKIFAHKFTGTRTALHVLAKHIIPESEGSNVVEKVFAILASGISIDTQDGTFKTPFQQAVIAGNTGQLENLITLGVNPNASFREAGKEFTPLGYLMQQNDITKAKILLDILEDSGHLRQAVTILGDKLIDFAEKNGFDSLETLRDIKVSIDRDAAGADHDSGGGASTEHPYGYGAGGAASIDHPQDVELGGAGASTEPPAGSGAEG